MKFTLIIPTVNELAGCRAILPQIKREWVDEIIFVDGHSSDGTYEYLEAYAKQNDCILIKQKSKGLIQSYFEAMAAAKGDVMIPFSPDGNSLPEKIPVLVAKMKEGYDMVIVSRYCQGAKSEDDDPVTSFGNWMFTTLINVLFGGHYTDTLVMFRAWKRSVVEEGHISASVGGIEPQLAIQCAKRKLKVADIPGDEPKRIGGIRKMSPLKNGLGIIGIIMTEFFRK